jgi:hypothetical protein
VFIIITVITAMPPPANETPPSATENGGKASVGYQTMHVALVKAKKKKGRDKTHLAVTAQ